MEQISTNLIAEHLITKLKGRGKSSGKLAKLFREYDGDELEVAAKIVSNCTGRLIGDFRKKAGTLMLTATSVKLGRIALGYLQEEEISEQYQKPLMLQLGDTIIDSFVSLNYMTLHREEFRLQETVLLWHTADEKAAAKLANSKLKPKKFDVNFSPYTLEAAPKFFDLTIEETSRNSISFHKYTLWTSDSREIDGSTENLIKSNVKWHEDYATKDFVLSANKTEQICWKINSELAEISAELTNDILDPTLRVTDELGIPYDFDARDIYRVESNKALAGLTLFYKGAEFNPAKGNVKDVKKAQKELAKERKRLKGLKSEAGIKMSEKTIKFLEYAFNCAERVWLDKQECLKLVSRVNSNKAILQTISEYNHQPFYQSVFLDYRGRTYFRDAFFSYQGCDFARAHFLFNKEKEVNQRGVEHTFIAAADSFNQSFSTEELANEELEYDYITPLKEQGLTDLSVDKFALIDRHNWTVNNLDFIQLIASDPITHKDMWMNCEKPWMFLALCLDINNLLIAIDNGVKYYSGLPIAKDGSNNGSQHLSAMALDETAGAYVGLTDTDFPNDLYVLVAKGIIDKSVEIEDLNILLSNMKMKEIRKGVSKRGTMVIAYDAGVSKIAESMFQDCYQAGYTAKYNITFTQCISLAKFLVKSYSEICSGPVQVKEYLKGLVKHAITNMKVKVITWATPSGFPAHQEKFVSRKRSVKGTIQCRQINHVYLEVTDIPALTEHQTAIGANVVHSYDAAHLSITTNQFDGVLAPVHDSFATHAADVDDLLFTLKEVFIKMYDTEDFFEVIRQHIVWDDIDCEVLTPKKGTLNLNDIRNADYFFA